MDNAAWFLKPRRGRAGPKKKKKHPQTKIEQKAAHRRRSKRDQSTGPILGGGGGGGVGSGEVGISCVLSEPKGERKKTSIFFAEILTNEEQNDEKNRPMSGQKC